MLLLGILWFASTVALIHVPWVMSFRNRINLSLMLGNPASIEWYNWARYLLFETLLFGYRESFIVVLIGIGLLLL